MSRERAAPKPAGSAQLLAVAAWFGLLAGVLESLSHLGRRAFDAVPISLGAYLAWMPAAANLLLFLLLGLLLLPFHRRWPALVTRGRLIAVFGTLAGLAALAAVAGLLGAPTTYLIALGLGVQAGRVLGPRWDRLLGFLRIAVPVALALLLTAAVGIEIRYRFLEGRALASLPEASAGAPNVLLLILDTVRAENLGAYGYRLPTTPVITRLAEAGVRFGRAHSTAPWTLPSHASMMTGRWAHELSTDWETPLDGRDSTIAEALAARGYRTGAMVANLGYTSRWTGLDRGFAWYEAHEVSFPQVLRTASLTRRLYDLGPLAARLPAPWGDSRRKSAREVNDALLRWLDRTPRRPFFAFLNYIDAHDPYLPLEPFDTAFAGAEYPPLPTTGHDWHKAARPRPILPYDQAIASIDAEIGRLLDELERRGLSANTLVIVTSDHGEEFGEHGMYGHGHTLYLPALRVPLVMALPDRGPGGLIVEAPVSLRDLPATVLDVVSEGGSQPFPGTSLARFWRDPLPAGDTLLAETRWARNRPTWDATSRGDLQGLITGDLAFIRDADLAGELYQVSVDSAQRANLAGDSAWAATASALDAHLDRHTGRPAKGPGAAAE